LFVKNKNSHCQGDDFFEPLNERMANVLLKSESQAIDALDFEKYFYQGQNI